MVEAAEKSRAEVAIVKDRAELLLKGISVEKKITEVKLAKAQPALNAAEAALLVRSKIITIIVTYNVHSKFSNLLLKYK